MLHYSSLPVITINQREFTLDAGHNFCCSWLYTNVVSARPPGREIINITTDDYVRYSVLCVLCLSQPWNMNTMFLLITCMREWGRALLACILRCCTATKSFYSGALVVEGRCSQAVSCGRALWKPSIYRYGICFNRLTNMQTNLSLKLFLSNIYWKIAESCYFKCHL